MRPLRGDQLILCARHPTGVARRLAARFVFDRDRAKSLRLNVYQFDKAIDGGSPVVRSADPIRPPGGKHDRLRPERFRDRCALYCRNTLDARTSAIHKKALYQLIRLLS